MDFVNLVKSPEEIMRCIYDDPANGTSTKAGSTIGIRAAKAILDQRKVLEKYSTLDQLLAVKGIGEDKVNDMLYSMQLTKLNARDYLLLHDEEFQKSLKEINKDGYKTNECTFCGSEKKEKEGDCGCTESGKITAASSPSPATNTGGITIVDPGVGVLNPITTPIVTVNPCGGTLMTEASFLPNATTPLKTIRVNLVIIQKEDGTGNFNEFDPDHNNALDIAESHCNWMYRNVGATGTGTNCNQMAHSRVQFDFKRIYLRDSELWNIDENWTRNNGNAISFSACPNLSINWPWRDLYYELRDQEDCNEEAITVFLVNSGIYLDDIQSQPEYVVQPAGSPTWLLPEPNYNLTNWAGHSPYVGGCSILPSNDPHTTNRGHVILCKNSYYDFIRTSRIVSTPPQAPNWHIGTGLGSLLSHEMGHLIMFQSHTASTSCGTNMMNANGWQHYLDTNQLSKLHRVLSTTDLRRTVREDHPVREITSDETWDRSVKMFGNIIIRGGNTLTITCELEMPLKGLIIVERGARLNVIGGTITSRCGFWGSIEVHGVAAFAHPTFAAVQNGSYPSTTNHHGVVYLENAVIENAAHAITTLRQESWGVDLAFDGGIVIATNTLFRNVRRAVAFMKYDFENISRFTNCTFETDPSAALFFEHGMLPFVTMWAVRGVKFLGNTFINRDAQGAFYSLDQRGSGIYSIDSNYEVSAIKQNGVIVRNEFINLVTAIGSDGTTTNPSNLIIRHTLFDNCYQGIHLKGIVGARIETIECNIGSELSNIGEHYAFGIRIDGGRIIAIENSQFKDALNSTGSQYGVLMQNCVDGFNWVYGCTFSGITSGVRAGGRNNWFLTKCNRFQTKIGDVYLDRDFPSQTPGEIAIIQSFNPALGPANNEFTSATNNCANVGHHIHFDAFAAQNFIYILPSGANGTNLLPTCIINQTPWMFQSGIAAYCPTFMSQSKKGLKLADKVETAEMSKMLESLSSTDRKQAELLIKLSDALDKTGTELTDLEMLYKTLSKFVKVDENEQLISKISESASSSDRFMITETMREQLKFLQNAGAVAQQRLDSLNALENMLA